MKHSYTVEQVKEAVKDSLSIAEVLRKVGTVPAGGNYKVINDFIKKHNIDISHFTGQAWNVGTKFKPFCKSLSDEEVFIENSTYKNTSKLKERLLKKREHKCEICGNNEWQGHIIPLELHHINGNNMDNRLENLQLLCPNCHALTDTFRGKNLKSARNKQRQEDYEKYKDTVAESKELIKKTSNKSKKEKPKRYCAYCGKELTSDQKKYCSQECYRADALSNSKRPSLPDLIKAFKEYKSFVQVGNHFNVSDKSVQKWCSLYGIPIHIKELTEYINQLGI